MCEGHQFSVAETVYADIGAVRAALLNVQNFDQFTSVAHSLQALSEDEFSGLGRPLFLRDLISLRLAVPGNSQVRDSVGSIPGLASLPLSEPIAVLQISCLYPRINAHFVRITRVRVNNFPQALGRHSFMCGLL